MDIQERIWQINITESRIPFNLFSVIIILQHEGLINRKCSIKHIFDSNNFKTSIYDPVFQEKPQNMRLLWIKISDLKIGMHKNTEKNSGNSPGIKDDTLEKDKKIPSLLENHQFFVLYY